jgi:hypothetical protein
VPSLFCLSHRSTFFVSMEIAGDLRQAVYRKSCLATRPATRVSLNRADSMQELPGLRKTRFERGIRETFTCRVAAAHQMPSYGRIELLKTTIYSKRFATTRSRAAADAAARAGSPGKVHSK